MPTRPPSPDPSQAPPSDATAFGGLNAGLSFFQDWMKAAGSALPHLQGTPGLGGKGATPWGLPTLDPDELDKRIQDLKTVQFWLEQNSRLIAMTIQGLEVQRMTLSTLRGMNVSMDAVRESLKARAEPTSPSPSPAPVAEPPTDGGGPGAQASVNPLRWWDTLTQQFTQLASQAVQVVQAGAQGLDTGAAAAPANAPEAAPMSPPSSPRPAEGPAAASTKVPVQTNRGPGRRAPLATPAKRRAPGTGSAD